MRQAYCEDKVGSSFQCTFDSTQVLIDLLSVDECEFTAVIMIGKQHSLSAADIIRVIQYALHILKTRKYIEMLSNTHTLSRAGVDVFSEYLHTSKSDSTLETVEMKRLQSVLLSYKLEIKDAKF